MASIGIIGGMGPLATVKLFEKIVLNTAVMCDQDHVRIYIDNNAQIPDRTGYILNGGEDPGEKITRTVKNLLGMGADYLIMPCNTAHFFAERIVEIAGDKFINMIEETAKAIKSSYPDKKRIVLMATKGTYEGRVYQKIFTKYDIDIIAPTDSEKEIIMDLIYKIKIGKTDNAEEYNGLLKNYCDRGMDCFILGCTELSVANEIFDLTGIQIDPLKIIALEAIKKAGGIVINA